MKRRKLKPHIVELDVAAHKSLTTIHLRSVDVRTRNVGVGKKVADKGVEAGEIAQRIHCVADKTAYLAVVQGDVNLFYSAEECAVVEREGEFVVVVWLAVQKTLELAVYKVDFDVVGKSFGVNHVHISVRKVEITHGNLFWQVGEIA